MICSVNESDRSMCCSVFPVVRACSVRIKNAALTHEPWEGTGARHAAGLANAVGSCGPFHLFDSHGASAEDLGEHGGDARTARVSRPAPGSPFA